MLVLVLSLSLSGCQKIAVWMTRSTQPAVPASGQVGSPEGNDPESANRELRQQRSQRNAELLQELYRVVLVLNPSSPAAFGNWLDSLNQGATLEGVYRGFTRSQLQQQLEADRRSTATPHAVGVFSRELAQVLLAFPQMPKIDESEAKPLQAIAFPGEAEADLGSEGMQLEPPREIVFRPFATPTAAPSTEPRPEPSVVVGRVGAVFAGASIFTLKRVLGDWALKLIETLLELSRPQLIDWYADFAARTATLSVDFGLAPRQEPTRRFHRDWAERATEDQLRWEVLNRLHRILNDAQKLRPAATTVAPLPISSKKPISPQGDPR